MQRINIFAAFGLFTLFSLLLPSCNKDFLNKYPQTSIAPENFFKNTADLNTYCNSFYSQLSFPYTDNVSDNISIYNESNEIDALTRGILKSSDVTTYSSGWTRSSWAKLRSINFMLDHISGVAGDSADINSYVGIARFFRALFYYGMVKRYSDVPWINHAIDNTDTAALYGTVTPRAIVMDSVLNDLQFAVDHIKQASNEDYTRITKWSALALMSRICLYEGTYRKYHAELGLTNDYMRFLQKSQWASEQIISGGLFHISGSSAIDFRNLFDATTLAGNPEVLLWAQYDPKLNSVGTELVLSFDYGLSKNLEQTFLMNDGSRFTDIPGHDTIGYVGVFKNRDPRLAETYVYPGFTSNTNNSYPYFGVCTFGLYAQVKFYPRDPSQRAGYGLNNSAVAMFRYAEVLLNEIESKAEQGLSIQQNDIDATINLLRQRVGMPSMELAAVQSNIDPVLAAYYPNVTGNLKGLILEIRRERRVELACEGLRFDDMQRWAIGSQLATGQVGVYVPKLGGIDLTGDGLPDIAILNQESDTTALKASLSSTAYNNIGGKFTYLTTTSDGVAPSIYLTNGTSGNIGFLANKNVTRAFVSPQYYYRPIPQQEITLNPNLKQPFGW